MRKQQYSPASEDGNEDETTPGDFPEIDHISFYTLGIYFILSLPLILSASRAMSYVFTTGKVSYRCLVPECENPANVTFNSTWLPHAIPYTDGKPETCKRFIVQNSTDSCSPTAFSNETEICQAWVYGSEESTILNEWDLTCDKNLWKLTLPGTMNSVGQFVGLLISGHLSDKYGRRKVLVTCTTLSSIFGLIRSLSVNYQMFVTFEFLDAMAGSAVYSAVFVIGMEFVGPKKRVLASSVPNCMYVVYTIYLGLFAMWLKSWRILLRVFYAPGLLAILLLYVVPEPVRWLQNKGRLEEAEAVLRKIAARNKIGVSERSILMIRNPRKEFRNENTTVNPSRVSAIKEIIGNRTMLVRLLICVFCWIANTFVYYGLSLRSVAVPGDKYINFMLVASVEIPAYFTLWILADYLGRKPTLVIAYLFSGIFCIVTIFVPIDWWYLPIIVFVAGKFCITITYNLVYMYTTEIFPTQLRHSLLTLCSMIGRIGSVLAPQTPLLANYMESLPLILFGIMGLSASLLSLNFPETLGVKLPDTVTEAKNIGKVKRENLSCLKLSDQTNKTSPECESE